MISIDRHFPFLHILSDEDIFNRAWIEATDEEKQLAKLTALEMALQYQAAKVAGDEARCIIIQHFLSLRLTTIQVDATIKASYIGLGGVVLGAILGFIISNAARCP